MSPASHAALLQALAAMLQEKAALTLEPHSPEREARQMALDRRIVAVQKIVPRLYG